MSDQQLKVADLVICHPLLWDDLPTILKQSPLAKIVSVSTGGPTFASVQLELARTCYAEDDRHRVFGATTGNSVLGIVQLWPKLVRFFSGGNPAEDVARFLGLEQPVRLMALSAALQVSRRELVRSSSPRIELAKLLDPALKLARDAGREDIGDHIGNALKDQDSALNEVEQALELLQGKASKAGE